MTKKVPSMRKKQAAPGYDTVLADVSALLETARRATVRTTNAIMTATYWEIGRRIVEYEQGGESRAGYGEQLLERLSLDLKKRFGRGFGVINLRQMRTFYKTYPQTIQTMSGQSEGIRQTLSDEFNKPRLQSLTVREECWKGGLRRRSIGRGNKQRLAQGAISFYRVNRANQKLE